MKKLIGVLVRLDEAVYNRILEEVQESPSNGRFGSGVAGYIKKKLYKDFDVEVKNYHDNPRGPRRRRASSADCLEVDPMLDELFT